MKGFATVRFANGTTAEGEKYTGPTERVDEVVRAYCRSMPPPIQVSREDLETLLDPVPDAIASFVATTLRNLRTRWRRR